MRFEDGRDCVFALCPLHFRQNLGAVLAPPKPAFLVPGAVERKMSRRSVGGKDKRTEHPRWPRHVGGGRVQSHAKVVKKRGD